MTAPVAARAVLAATVWVSCSCVQAAWQCTDWSGRTFVSGTRIDAGPDIRCVAMPATDDAAPRPLVADSRQTPEGLPQRRGMALQDVSVAPVLGGGGRLALQPAAMAQSAVPAGRVQYFEDLIREVALQLDHDADLLRAIVHVESRFNPDAVSPAGAIGLMQLMPATARQLGVEQPLTSLRDPRVNLRAGARLLRGLLDSFPGRLDLALAAYNAGEGAVRRHRGVPPYEETRNYVQLVMGRYEALRDGRP